MSETRRGAGGAPPDARAHGIASTTIGVGATVMPDERRFLDRESAWLGRFLDEPPWPDPLPRYRVLAFGAELEGGATATLDRPSATVASVWLDDRDEALALARAVDGHAFAAETAVLRPPPGA